MVKHMHLSSLCEEEEIYCISLIEPNSLSQTLAIHQSHTEDCDGHEPKKMN